MPKFVIKEQVTSQVHIEAENAQEALHAWLNMGKDADGFIGHHEDVDERHVEDEKGVVCDVEDE